MTSIANLKENIKIPTGVEVKLQNNSIQVKGPKGEISRYLFHPRLSITIQENNVQIACKNTAHRRDKAMVGSFIAHIKNMIVGVTTGHVYSLKTVYSHFPIKTSVEGNTVIIQNFLGERAPRKAKILENVKVEVKGDMITVSGFDLERVGQTATNIERATRVKNRDIRVFQDGIYVVNKGD